MSKITRFKWERALPPAGAPGNPAFTLFSKRPLRQLASTVGIASEGAGYQMVFEAFVPKNSWGYNKLVLVRAVLNRSTTVNSGIIVCNVESQISVSQANAVNIGNASGFFPQINSNTYSREFRFIRIDPYIYMLNSWEQVPGPDLNSPSYVDWATPIAAIVPPFDYTQEITLQFQASCTGAGSGLQLGGLWCEAFLEQGTNLGALA